MICAQLPRSTSTTLYPPSSCPFQFLSRANLYSLSPSYYTSSSFREASRQFYLYAPQTTRVSVASRCDENASRRAGPTACSQDGRREDEDGKRSAIRFAFYIRPQEPSLIHPRGRHRKRERGLFRSLVRFTEPETASGEFLHSGRYKQDSCWTTPIHPRSYSAIR